MMAEIIAVAASVKGRNQRRRRFTGILCGVSLLSMGWAAPALAQERPQAGFDDSEIIVMARKREESILKVPVIVTAISNEQIDNVAITNVTELPKLAPGLLIAGNLLSIGPQVTLRGVGTSSFDPGVDQSISLNIDGLSLGQGLAFGSAMFDVGQVEVLRGPQALFFGKSSPGGVISLRTADPTDEYEIMARAGYEFYARETRGELVVSGPVTDTLKARVATMYSAADGWFKNNAIAEPGTGATARPQPAPEEFRGPWYAIVGATREFLRTAQGQPCLGSSDQSGTQAACALSGWGGTGLRSVSSVLSRPGSLHRR